MHSTIAEELKSNGFKLTFIRAFSKNGYGIQFYITLANIGQAKEIYEVSKLFFVKTEPYRSLATTQCYKRQNVGQPSLQCGHSARCVNCDDACAFSSCTKSPGPSATTVD